MAFVPVPNCVQARLMYIEDNGVVAQNVFYHATAGVPTEDDLTAIGGMWGETITAHLVTSTTNNWQWQGV